jgi:hypothetical protein
MRVDLLSKRGRVWLVLCVLSILRRDLAASGRIPRADYDGFAGVSRPPLTSELRLALEACMAAMPLLTGEITFRYVDKRYKAQGVTYHQLAQLARLGYKTRSAEGRYGVYYRVAK